MAEDSGIDDIPWHLGVFDAHCHPTDTVSSLQAISGMRAKVLTVMATRGEDQDLVAKLAEEFGIDEAEAKDPDIGWSKSHKVIPAFGWHPWFSHQIYDDAILGPVLTSTQKLDHYRAVLAPKPEDETFISSLPSPIPLSSLLSQTKSRLNAHRLALIGEVGLDRSFRLPENWGAAELEARDDSRTPGGRESRRLSPYRVQLAHQKVLLTAQLRLAGEMHRAVSVHGVQAHGVVYETLAATWKGHERKLTSNRERKKAKAENARLGKDGESADDDDDDDDDDEVGGSKPFPPRVCLHSYSGPAETVKQYVHPSVPCEVYFSFSVTINAWVDDGEGKVEAAVKAVPDDRVLIESDLHTAGEQMDGFLAAVIRRVCRVKGWELEAGTRRLSDNWKRFVFGNTSDGASSSEMK